MLDDYGHAISRKIRREEGMYSLTIFLVNKQQLVLASNRCIAEDGILVFWDMIFEALFVYERL